MATEKGKDPVAKDCCAAKEGVVAPGVVVFSSTDTLSVLALATARSGLPSPLRSPMATERGPVPVAKVCWKPKVGVVAPGAVVLSSTDTLLESRLAMTRSGLPSPLRSPMATDTGPDDTASAAT